MSKSLPTTETIERLAAAMPRRAPAAWRIDRSDIEEALGLARRRGTLRVTWHAREFVPNAYGYGRPGERLTLRRDAVGAPWSARIDVVDMRRSFGRGARFTVES